MRTLSEGHYLLPGDTESVVVGCALVERLDVGLSDDLVLTLSRADSELEYSMLRIRTRDCRQWIIRVGY